MSDPFLGEIRMVGFNFAPRGWAFCNGQLLPISQNTALFALLGIIYGGDGRTTFALPNLQGHSPMHPGQGPGLSLRDIGETTGTSTVSLISSELPSHTHQARASSDDANSTSPINSAWGLGAVAQYRPDNDTSMNANALAPVGGNQPHNNMQPYLTVNFVIALQGIFPPRG